MKFLLVLFFALTGTQDRRTGMLQGNFGRNVGALLETLRQIADDPAGYVLRHGWTAIDLGDSDELKQLQKLFNSLEAEIIAVIEATDALKESPDYELYRITEREPEVFERGVERQIAWIEEGRAEGRSGTIDGGDRGIDGCRDATGIGLKKAIRLSGTSRRYCRWWRDRGGQTWGADRSWVDDFGRGAARPYPS
jgi:hypothetical protein